MGKVKRICEVCGKEFYTIPYIVKQGWGKFCSKKCRGQWLAKNKRGQNSPTWKDGREIDKGGYILVWISPDSPFYPMVDSRGYVREHRLVVAQSLGRCLKSYEIVHHINGIRDDNRIENLQLLSSQVEHLPSMFLMEYIKELERENTELKEQLKKF